MMQTPFLFCSFWNVWFWWW